jgi:hypothetical protein
MITLCHLYINMKYTLHNTSYCLIDVVKVFFGTNTENFLLLTQIRILSKFLISLSKMCTSEYWWRLLWLKSTELLSASPRAAQGIDFASLYNFSSGFWKLPNTHVVILITFLKKNHKILIWHFHPSRFVLFWKFIGFMRDKVWSLLLLIQVSW